MRRGIAIEYLDFVTVLQVNAAVSAGFGDQELHMRAEILELLFGNNIRRAV
ncbi:hypothetical protein D3C86_2048970 [compost metagenome]